MIPIGFMAKRIESRPDWVEASHIKDIYSVSGCLSAFFTDYITAWKHNGYWFFDSIELIREVAQETGCDLSKTTLFYYEAYELEFDDVNWSLFAPEKSFTTNVVPPGKSQLEGFDAVTYTYRGPPACSPLSCNSLASQVSTNRHCLLESLEQAKNLLDKGFFVDSEPGPYRIIAVYSTNWQ